MESGAFEVGRTRGRRGAAVLQWLAVPASRTLWCVLVVVLCAGVVRVGLQNDDGGMDNAIVIDAARTWLAGGSPYDDPHFLYLPSAVLAAVPEVLLPTWLLRFAAPAFVTAALTAGWVCALRLYGVGLRSRYAVGGLLALALGFAPFAHLLVLANWTVIAAAVLPAALLLAHRGRWTAAGAAIGAAIAFKPLLVPVLLLFVFARRWRALGAAVLVPAAASGLAALAMPDPAGFFTRTLPFLLRGDDSFVRLYEASPAAVLPRLGVPQGAASLLALACAAGGVWCAWRRWGRGDAGSAARLGECAAMVMLAAFLVSRPSYDHYLLVVVPLLLAGAGQEGAPGRTAWFWVALVPQVPGFAWPWLQPGTRRAFKDAFTLCVLAVTVGRCCLRRGRVHLPRARTLDAAAPSGERAF
ncbi:glycosyltransferase 87 family protein [Streptomyces sp. NPDC050418]|uniref:glycosyltransferase 87 family protein n=1 Tax=Streptomyces sp. NPDC050418 TaxID=3365612 RepID=UPI0037929AFA